jgi:hypothetical protein
MTEDFKPEKGEHHSDPVDVNKVKEKIRDYITLMYTNVQQCCKEISLTEGQEEKKKGLRIIYANQKEIYN